jgi:hypothetical protein
MFHLILVLLVKSLIHCLCTCYEDKYLCDFCFWQCEPWCCQCTSMTTEQHLLLLHLLDTPVARSLNLYVFCYIQLFTYSIMFIKFMYSVMWQYHLRLILQSNHLATAVQGNISILYSL